MAQRLAQHLISRGLLPASKVDRALRLAEEKGCALDTALLELGLVSEAGILQALSDVSGLQLVNLADFEPNLEAAKLLPVKIAGKLSIAPLSIEGDALHVAVAYPPNKEALKEVGFLLGKRLEPWVALECRVLDWVATVYQVPLPRRVHKVLRVVDPARHSQQLPLVRASDDRTEILSAEVLELVRAGVTEDPIPLSKPKPQKRRPTLEIVLDPKAPVPEETVVIDAERYTALDGERQRFGTGEVELTSVLDTGKYEDFARSATRRAESNPEVPVVKASIPPPPAVAPAPRAAGWPERLPPPQDPVWHETTRPVEPGAISFPGGVLPPPRRSGPDEPATQRDVKPVSREWVTAAPAPRPRSDAARPRLPTAVPPEPRPADLPPPLPKALTRTARFGVPAEIDRAPETDFSELDAHPVAGDGVPPPAPTPSSAPSEPAMLAGDALEPGPTAPLPPADAALAGPAAPPADADALAAGDALAPAAPVAAEGVAETTAPAPEQPGAEVPPEALAAVPSHAVDAAVAAAQEWPTPAADAWAQSPAPEDWQAFSPGAAYAEDPAQMGYAPAGDDAPVPQEYAYGGAPAQADPSAGAYGAPDSYAATDAYAAAYAPTDPYATTVPAPPGGAWGATPGFAPQDPSQGGSFGTPSTDAAPAGADAGTAAAPEAPPAAPLARPSDPDRLPPQAETWVAFSPGQREAPPPPEPPALRAAPHPPPAEPGPARIPPNPAQWTLPIARAALKQASHDREELLDVVLSWGRRVFDYVAAFGVVRGVAVGWAAQGDGDTGLVRQVSVPLDAASVFRTVAVTRGSYMGPVPPDALTPHYLALLGRSPRTLFAWPVEVGARLVAILYGDCTSRPLSQRKLSEFILFCQDLPGAFHDLVAARKQATGKHAAFSPRESNDARPPSLDEAPAAVPPAPETSADQEWMSGLIQLLTGPDATERANAMTELMRTPDAAAEALVRAFPGPTAWSRLPVVELPEADELGPIPGALARLGRAGAIALAPLLDSEDSDTRYLALLTAGALKHAEVVDGVLRGLFDMEPDLSSAARAAAGALRAQPRFQEMIPELRLELRARDPMRRSLAARALGALKDRGAVEGLIDLVDDVDEVAAQAATEGLREVTCQNFGADRDAWQRWWEGARKLRRVEWLVEALLSFDFEVRLQAIEELTRSAGDNLGYFAESADPDRAAGVARWMEWLAARPDFDL